MTGAATGEGFFEIGPLDERPVPDLSLTAGLPEKARDWRFVTERLKAATPRQACYMIAV